MRPTNHSVWSALGSQSESRWMRPTNHSVWSALMNGLNPAQQQGIQAGISILVRRC